MIKQNSLEKIKSLLKLTLLGSLLLGLSGCMKQQEGPAKPKKQTQKSKKSNKSDVTPAPAKEIKKGMLQSESGEATFEEIVAQIEFDVQKSHYLSAVQWLDKVIRRYPEHPDLAEFKYKRAECCFLGKKFMLASEAYDNFATLYPSDPRAKEAKFLALSSLYNYTKNFSVDCDSTGTKNVIEACNKMLGDESMTEKHKQVTSIMKHCQERLLNKEVAIFDSYVRRKKFDSASKRLEKIKSEYLAENKQLEPRIVFLECKLASANQDEAKVKNCLEILEEQFSDSKYTKMASGYVNAGTFASAIYG